MELLADISVVCPQCRAQYRMRGVQTGQDLICFKCGQMFEAKKEIMSAIVDSPMKEVVIEEEKPKLNRSGSWTWLLFFTFILFCLFKVAMGPTPQTSSTTNSAELLNQALAHFDLKEYGQAAPALESYFGANPSMEEKTKLDLFWKLAVSHEKTGNVPAAVQWYQKILQEFGKEKDFKIHSARKALSRLEGTAAAQ